MENKLRLHIEKIIDLTNDEYVILQSYFQPKSFKKREFIIRENDQVEEVYFIISGLLKLSYTDDEAKEHIISFAMDDWWETDFLAFYTQTKATLALQCIENTEAYSLSLKGYHELCARFPKMEHFFLQKSIAGHIANQRRILSLLTLSAKERYEQLLALYPSLLQRLPKSLLAAYLGVTRETLSRLFA